MYALLRKNAKWHWNRNCEKSFDKAKLLLTGENLLVHIDTQKLLVLSVNASPYGVGAVLSHVINGTEKPIA